MKKKIGALLCLVMIMILLVGCGEKSVSLVGAWMPDSEENPGFEFYSDGTGIESDELGDWALNWTAENGKIKITVDVGIFGTMVQSFDYELNDDILILNGDEGESATYTRVKESK